MRSFMHVDGKIAQKVITSKESLLYAQKLSACYLLFYKADVDGWRSFVRNKSTC